MRSTPRFRTVSRLTLALALAGSVSLTLPGSAGASETKAEDGDKKAAASVEFIVLRENGVGSAAAAQRYIDQLATAMAKVAGWAGASGKYHSSRTLAQKHIATSKPHFGFLSYNAFLAMTPEHKLTTLGKAKIKGGGGGQYFVLSKTHHTIDDCKGKSLASNHAGDAAFVDAIVFGGDVQLADFELQTTRRPVQTLKAVISGDAECALVDDAQVASLASIDGGLTLNAVWHSGELPSVVVVAFPSAPADEVKAFSAALPKICSGEGKKACDAAGIEALENTAKDTYKADLAKYQKLAK